MSTTENPYVYALLDQAGAPFYIGKGRGKRMFQHEHQARRGKPGAKCDRIREIIASGAEVGYSVLGEYSTDHEAGEAEKEYIAMYSGLTNKTKGGELGSVITVQEGMRRRAARNLSMVVPKDSWLASLSEARRALISKVFGSPEQAYDKFVSELIGQSISPAPNVVCCDSAGNVSFGWGRI